MPGELDALIHELEIAPRGSRELSDKVLLALGWHVSVRGGYWNQPTPDERGSYPCYEAEERPSPTESVDDAIAECERIGECDFTMRFTGRNSAALSLCAALIRAVQARPASPASSR